MTATPFPELSLTEYYEECRERRDHGVKLIHARAICVRFEVVAPVVAVIDTERLACRWARAASGRDCGRSRSACMRHRGRRGARVGACACRTASTAWSSRRWSLRPPSTMRRRWRQSSARLGYDFRVVSLARERRRQPHDAGEATIAGEFPDYRQRARSCREAGMRRARSILVDCLPAAPHRCSRADPALRARSCGSCARARPSATVIDHFAERQGRQLAGASAPTSWSSTSHGVE